ncbi:DUF2142 domain-containing protein [Bifidobacterium sp. ESL0690]|uniref:DUF2142 domain-containing protein n=1 Tax=Bifidobacterium sp. ESL0690 TaxID=2983214 RepID=UPI0023F8EDF9|nr:DUF2142 domain-containing protein [Bifidobacterium sp. ESL0690]WEV46571.1 DUF2142 domain-containing protein [Bifidobacterium sp. ESL0690]
MNDRLKRLLEKWSAKPTVGAKRNLLIVLVFVVVCAAEGAMFIQTTGPLSIPDTDLHANSIYAVVTGQEFNPVQGHKDPYGNQVRVQHITGDSRYLFRTGMHNGMVSDLLEEFHQEASRQNGRHSHASFLSHFLYDKHRVIQESTDRQHALTVTIPVKTLTNRSNQYFPIVYAPQALGVWIGMKIGLSPFANWQLGRITNFLLFLALYALAIAILPRGKAFLAILGVLPMTVFMASSLMADALFISVATLFVALVLKCAESGGRMGNGALAGLVALTALLVFCKGVYVALALLVMVLPKKVLSTKRKIGFVAVSMLVSLPIYGVWSVMFSSTFPNVNVAQNVAYAGKRPVKIVAMVLYSTLSAFWQNAPKYSFDVMAFVVLIVVWLGYIAYNRRVFKTKKNESWIAVYRYALTSLVILALILLAIYAIEALIWNRLYYMGWNDYLMGMEERYFFPLLPLLLTVAYTDKAARADLDYRQ